MGTAARDSHTTVVERRRRSLLSWLEPRESSLIEGTVDGTGHQVKWSLAAIAPARVNLQSILLVQRHSVLAHRVLNRSEFFII